MNTDLTINPYTYSYTYTYAYTYAFAYAYAKIQPGGFDPVHSRTRTRTCTSTCTGGRPTGVSCIYLCSSVVYLRPMNDLEEGRALRLDFSKLLRATAAAPNIVPVSVVVTEKTTSRIALL